MPDEDRSRDAAGFGHNGGPPLENRTDSLAEEDGKYLVVAYCWKRAHEAAWKNVPYDILMFRQSRAEAAGVSYHDYTLEILERGRYLQRADMEPKTRCGRLVSAAETGSR